MILVNSMQQYNIDCFYVTELTEGGLGDHMDNSMCVICTSCGNFVNRIIDYFYVHYIIINNKYT